MKYDLTESVSIIENRIHTRKIRKIRRSICSLSVLCALLIGVTVFSLYRFIDFGATPDSYSVYGTLMIPAESGLYVLVGVTSFCVAVGLTLLCLYIKKRKDSSIKDQTENDN